MSALKITQTTGDGRKKIWKVDANESLLTLGAHRKSDFNSIDRDSESYDVAIENREDGWHFITFDVKAEHPDTKITDNMTFKFADSQLLFNVIAKEEYILSALERVSPQITAGQVQRKILIVSKNNRVLRTQVKNLNDKFKYSIAGVSHELPFLGKPDWEHHEIEGFHFKSKVLNLNETSQLERIPTENMVDKESKRLLVAALCSMTLLVAIGLLTPKKEITEEITLPQASSTLIMKVVEPKRKKESNAVKSPSSQASATAAKAQKQVGSAKVNAMLKGAIGVRISQLMGKVSAAEARTAQVLVTKSGIAAGSAESGRALAAVGKVDSSGRNWNGEAVSGKRGISTAGVGGGNGTGAMGAGLAAGKTGAGGVGLIEEESEVTGGLDREVIAQYIKSQLGQILYCYERQLSANPDLYGKVTVKFTISGNGQVESQAINQTTLKSVPVEGCILSKVAKWKFPEPKGGTKVVVNYPFLFKSTN